MIFFLNPNDSKSGLTCQSRYVGDQKNLDDVNTDFSISLFILQPVLREQHQCPTVKPNQPKQDTLFYILPFLFYILTLTLSSRVQRCE